MSEHVDALSPAGVSELAAFIIRPPRAHYSRHDLGDPLFTLHGIPCRRDDVTVQSARNLQLQASHFRPCTAQTPTTPITNLPTVIYLHGNGSCRVESTMLLSLFLPYSVSVFSFDFSGSGRSQGDYISLGVHEKHDIAAVIKYLNTTFKIPYIVLWGHSMGAATALMYSGMKDEYKGVVKGLVLDSSFASFDKLAQTMVNDMPLPIGIPKKLILTVGVRAIRKLVRERAGFDVHDIDPLKALNGISNKLPALFIHGTKDAVVPEKHGKLLFDNYPCKHKCWLPLKGLEHDSPRPPSTMDRAFDFVIQVIQQAEGNDYKNGDGDTDGKKRKETFMIRIDAVKTRGNEALLSGRYEDAIFLYGRALERLVHPLNITNSNNNENSMKENINKRAVNILGFRKSKSGSINRASGRNDEQKKANVTNESLNIGSSNNSPKSGLVKRWRSSRGYTTSQDIVFSGDSGVTVTDDEGDGSTAVSRRQRMARKSRERSRRRASTDMASLRWAPTATNVNNNESSNDNITLNDSNIQHVVGGSDLGGRRDGRKKERSRFNRQKSWRGGDSASAAGGSAGSNVKVRVVERLKSLRSSVKKTDNSNMTENDGIVHGTTKELLNEDTENDELGIDLEREDITDNKNKRIRGRRKRSSSKKEVGARERKFASRTKIRYRAMRRGERWRMGWSSNTTTNSSTTNGSGRIFVTATAPPTTVPPNNNQQDQMDLGLWRLDDRSKALALALLGNRSLARRKLGDVDGALSDACRCLKLDDGWIRGYVRKAAALREGGRMTEAETVARQGLEKDCLHAGLMDLLKCLENESNGDNNSQVEVAR